jgi:hypothetical protein
MPRRIRLKAAAPAPAQDHEPQTFDLSQIELPRKAIPAISEVEDPYDRSTRLRFLSNVRGDPARLMHSRGQIDHAQFMAARRWQQLWEMSEIGSLRGVNLSREPVDGGMIHEPITEAGRRARQRLKQCAEVLGMEGESLVRDILGKGLFIKDVAALRGLRCERELKYLGNRFQECLVSLSREFGYG